MNAQDFDFWIFTHNRELYWTFHDFITITNGRAIMGRAPNRELNKRDYSESVGYGPILVLKTGTLS